MTSLIQWPLTVKYEKIITWLNSLFNVTLKPLNRFRCFSINASKILNFTALKLQKAIKLIWINYSHSAIVLLSNKICLKKTFKIFWTQFTFRLSRHTFLFKKPPKIFPITKCFDSFSFLKIYYNYFTKKVIKRSLKQVQSE